MEDEMTDEEQEEFERNYCHECDRDLRETGHAERCSKSNVVIVRIPGW